MTTEPKELTCSNGDIFLVRLGSGPNTDLIYLKLMFTDHTNNHHGAGGWSSVTFRWSNLYNRNSNIAGKIYCDISATMQPLLTHVAWTSYFAPYFTRSTTSDGGYEAVLIIYLIVFIVFFLVVVALAYWLKSVSKDHTRLSAYVLQQQGANARGAAPAAEGNVGAPGNAQEMQQVSSDFL
jgi:hypothetical protein